MNINTRLTIEIDLKDSYNINNKSIAFPYYYTDKVNRFSPLLQLFATDWGSDINPTRKILVDVINEYKSLRFKIIEKNGKVKKVRLPVKMSRRLLFIIKNGRPEVGFCCVDLITYLFNKYTKLNDIQLSEWSVTKYKKNKPLCCKDVVILAQKLDQPIQHLAMYLGSKVFISISGPTGQFLFMTLGEMKKLYDSKIVRILKPKTHFSRNLSENSKIET